MEHLPGGSDAATLLHDVLRSSSARTLHNNNSSTLTPNPPTPKPTTTTFEINVAKETFKFNAAHFVAYRGFRERLHGHNYQVAVRLLGSRTISHDGYLLDFGDLKKVVKAVCRDLNEFFLCPVLSDVMQISVLKGSSSNNTEEEEGGSKVAHDTVKIVCEDGATFLFPLSDCAMLPLVHATTEELAVYLWGKILSRLEVSYLLKRGIHTMEITCAEAPGQDALFRMEIPKDVGGEDGGEGGVAEAIERLTNVKSYISTGDLVPSPCLPRASAVSTRGGTTGDDDASHSLNMLQNAVVVPTERSGNNGVVGVGGGEDDGANSKLRCCANCSSSFSKQLQGLIDTTTTAARTKDGKGLEQDDESRELLESISKIQEYINK